MQGVLDIERDHQGLIEACMGLLAPDGAALQAGSGAGATLFNT
ncbi:MAG TPA: hypothetical protein VFW10_06000 [Steroidobacteraceae bacterium]|nr:hypothetical protein [Steroidobacteraceae bacterium]